MDIEIKHAEDSDCQSVSRFVRAALAADQPWGGHEINPDEVFWGEYSEKFVVLNRQDHRLFLIAWADDAAVGCLCGKAIELHRAFAPKKAFHVDIVYVAPESRQRGVATRLLQAGLRWAGHQGCQESHLNVLAGNANAIGLYKKLGFRTVRHEMRLEHVNPGAGAGSSRTAPGDRLRSRPEGRAPRVDTEALESFGQAVT